MIISFKCKDTEKLAGGSRVRRFVNFERIVKASTVSGSINNIVFVSGGRLQVPKMWKLSIITRR